jgi:hypothetical protein
LTTLCDVEIAIDPEAEADGLKTDDDDACIDGEVSVDSNGFIEEVEIRLGLNESEEDADVSPKVGAIDGSEEVEFV